MAKSKANQKRKKSFFERLTGDSNPPKKTKKVKTRPVKKTRKKPKVTVKKTNRRKTKSKQNPVGQLGIDLWETANALYLSATIAGVKVSDLDIGITSEQVSIRGRREQVAKVSKGETTPSKYFYQECYWGAFKREVALPLEIDADRAKAKLIDGVLTITLPKLAKSQVKKLEVAT